MEVQKEFTYVDQVEDLENHISTHKEPKSEDCPKSIEKSLGF